MSVEDDVLSALRRIIRATDQHSRALMARHGLTAPQWIVLRALVRDGERSIGDLAIRMQVSQPTVTGIVSRLERRGLVARHRCRFDRRRVLVDATEAGRRTLEAAPPLLQERFLARLRRLEEWERHQILASLERIVTLMEAHELDASPVLVTGPIDADDDLTPVADGGDR